MCSPVLSVRMISCQGNLEELILSDTLNAFVSGLVLGAIIASHTNCHISTAVMREMNEAVMPNEHIHISSPYPHSWY